ncbi:hypothetical protein, partial [Acetobacter aceti]|uniref:hypothetical protein n=1 Tax=Acetobacter aceti TaxID=435 RepID=UPI001C60B9B4
IIETGLLHIAIPFLQSEPEEWNHRKRLKTQFFRVLHGTEIPLQDLGLLEKYRPIIEIIIMKIK